MRLTQQYAPRSLADMTGQPCVAELIAFAQQPYARCFLFESPTGGTGKTSAAIALAADLGCHDELSGLYVRNATEFGVDEAHRMLQQIVMLRPLEGNGWRVLVIDELEVLSGQCQRALKTLLDPNQLHPRCIVVATSNGAGGLDRALLQRFEPIMCFSAGPLFAQACAERMIDIWQAEMNDNEALPPQGYLEWGWDFQVQPAAFSFRVALHKLESALLMAKARDRQRNEVRA